MKITTNPHAMVNHFKWLFKRPFRRWRWDCQSIALSSYNSLANFYFLLVSYLRSFLNYQLLVGHYVTNVYMVFKEIGESLIYFAWTWIVVISLSNSIAVSEMSHLWCAWKKKERSKLNLRIGKEVSFSFWMLLTEGNKRKHFWKKSVFENFDRIC